MINLKTQVVWMGIKMFFSMRNPNRKILETLLIQKTLWEIRLWNLKISLDLKSLFLHCEETISNWKMLIFNAALKHNIHATLNKHIALLAIIVINKLSSDITDVLLWDSA